MKIERILNNNVIIIKDSFDIEQVVCGKGLAFKKKPGDEIDESLINKVFILKDEKSNLRLQELLLDIPVEHVELADEIYVYAMLVLGKDLNENLIISLSDHIYSSLNRYKDGIRFKNPMLWDIKRFYADEYEIALKAIKFIKDRFGVDLEEDEAGFITLHIVNSELEQSNIDEIVEITKLIQDVIRLVKYYFNTDFNTESVYYYRFMTHVKFFAQRLIKNNQEVRSDENALFETVRSTYKRAYNCVEMLEEYLKDNYIYQISDEEKLYLTIHIERMVEKSKK